MSDTLNNLLHSQIVQDTAKKVIENPRSVVEVVKEAKENPLALANTAATAYCATKTEVYWGYAVAGGVAGLILGIVLTAAVIWWFITKKMGRFGW